MCGIHSICDDIRKLKDRYFKFHTSFGVWLGAIAHHFCGNDTPTTNPTKSVHFDSMQSCQTETETFRRKKKNIYLDSRRLIWEEKKYTADTNRNNEYQMIL